MAPQFSTDSTVNSVLPDLNGYDSELERQRDFARVSGQKNPELISLPHRPSQETASSLSSIPFSDDPLLSEIVLPQRQGTPLRTQLLRAILPAVLIPLGIAGVTSYTLVSQRQEQQTAQLLQNQAQLASDVFSELLNEAERTPITLANNPLIINAARGATKTAEEKELAKLPLAQVEQSFSGTKLLQPSPTLNAYLAKTAEINKFAELFFTEKYGFNVASSNSTSDFVQSDEDWWQKTKTGSKGQFIEPKFDESAKTFGLELSQAITDPTSGQFLGVIKGVISAATFSSTYSNLVENLNIGRSQAIQLLALKQDGTVTAIQTINTQEVNNNRQELLGGEMLAQKVKTLVEAASKGALSSYSEAGIETVNSASGEPLLSLKFNDQTRHYVLFTVPKTNWVVAASIEQSELKRASQEAALTFSLTFLALGSIITTAVVVLARQLATPLRQLAITAEQVVEGNLNVRAKPEGTTESRVLAQVFNNLLEQVKHLLQEQGDEARSARLFGEIAASRARTPQDLEQVFNKAVRGAMDILKADRVVIYRLTPDWHGYISAEAVMPGWPEALWDKIEDPCIGENLIEAYRRGRVVATNNVYEAGFHRDHMRLMERLKIQANLVTPILKDDQLFGLLIAHHCADTHEWQESEVKFLTELAIQVGLSLDRVNFLEQVEQSRQEAERLAGEQLQQKEKLQHQLLDLLSDVEGAARGDLTVRADVTVGEIGTVADFFNSLVESLRLIVTQVKKASTEVNASLGQNEGAIRELSSISLKQAEEIIRTLDSVQMMTSSIQEVAEHARLAAEVARSASNTAVTGGVAMDRTVENIFSLRETVADTAKKVKRLGESSQRISKVASLIEQIAMQTKLLAINAGIEAAIAGEQGQGFAVVAEQVGELAVRAGTATKEIEQLVENIQLETAEVVQAMELGTSQVVEGTHLVEDAKQSLTQMLEVSHQIDALVESISSTTVSQAETSQIVNELMQEIARLSEHTSNSTRQVSSSLQSTVAIAQELQASVSTFKVGD